MNSSSIVKRTLPLIIVLVLIIGIAVSCTIFSGTRDIPVISKPNDAYASYTVNNNTITVNNDKMYQTLKPQGLSLAIDWVDKAILSNEKNQHGAENEKGKSFYDLALADNEALVELKSEAIYGDEDKKEAMTEEELDKAFSDYVKNMKSSGFKGISDTDDTIFTNEEKEYYAIQLARKLYAYDKLAQDIIDQNKLADDTADLDDDDDDKELPYFTETEISDYYSSNYKDGYWAIVIPYTSSKAVERALSQIGIKMSPTSTSSEGWLWEDNGQALTAAEILQAHIMLYNNAYAYKNSGEQAVDVAKYTFEYMSKSVTTNEKTTYSFDASKCDDIKEYFFYTYEELNTLNSAVRNRVAGTSIKKFFDSNTPTTTGKDALGYQKTAYTSSSKYYLILKLDIIEKEDLYEDEDEGLYNETIKNEIIEKLTEDEKTDDLVTKKMVQVRKDYNLAFYDDSLQTAYISGSDSTHEKTKKENKEAILKIEVNGETKYLSTDEYFKLVDARYGMTYLLDIINKETILSNMEANNVLSSYTPGMSYKDVKDKVKDSDKWNEMLEAVQTLKTNFAGNAFQSYGYPSTYGWNNFLKDFYLAYYGVLIESEEDLVIYNIYQEALAEYGTLLNTFVNDEDLQTLFTEKMQEQYDKYFKASGYHLLISVYEEDGKTIVSPFDEYDSEKDNTVWSTEQVTAAQNLSDDVLDLISKAKDPEKALADFVTAYDAAPFVSLYNKGTNEFGSYVPGGTKPEFTNENPYVYTGLTGNVSGVNIEISEYKSLGLSVKYEALSTFTTGDMVEEFETVAKYIWNTLNAEEGGIEYDNTNKTWTVSNSKFVATKDVVNAATEGEEDYLITEFGYHVYVQSGAEGFTGLTPTTSNEETDEVAKEYKQVRVPTVEEIKKYLEIVNSDEYKEILESENYTEGDEDKLFEKRNDDDEVIGYVLTEYQRLCIETFYTPIETELKGAYSISLALVKDVISNLSNLTINTTAYDKDQFAFVLDSHVDYNIEKLTYLKSLYE